MMQIRIDTNHMGDLWKLPVVTAAYKDKEGRTFLLFNDGQRKVRLADGDVITHDEGTGTWDVILTWASYKFNARLPCTTKIEKP